MTDPEVSVVVPTFDRPEALSECLAALARSKPPLGGFEVVVVDDGSVVPVDSVVRSFGDALDIQLVTQENTGPAGARNAGVAIARGRFLAFTDDDCQVDSGWLDALTTRLRESPTALVGGRTVNACANNLFSETSQLITESVYAHYNSTPRGPKFFTTNNMALARREFLELGGFDAGFSISACEDRDFCDRWTSEDRPMISEPQAGVAHASELSLRTFLRQHFTYGRGAYHYHRLRRRRGTSRLREDFRFHSQPRNWLLRPFRMTRPSRALPLAGLLLAWQVANAAGFAYEFVARSGYRRAARRPHSSTAP